MTAASTLVAAAAFRPLRARLQAAVDRRFDPARAHALRRIDAFLEELRAGRALPETFEPVLRDVLDDPTLELRFLVPETNRYVDALGIERMDPAADHRLRIPIDPLGVVLCDPGRHPSPAAVADVVAAGGLAVEIARLRVELRRQLLQVEDSRARIVAAGHEERRRIERDLHDGAQQRLVSVGLALRHAQFELGASPREHVDATLDDAVVQITAVIDELRELAQGLPPSQLDEGLAPALHELAARAPIPVEVQALDERVAPGVEAAAYFIACEGLTNVVKHARATAVSLTAVRDNGSLVVSVADDGVGGAAPADGSGLTGLADRVLAAGRDVPRRQRRRQRDHPGRGAAVRVVIAEDQALLRDGLGGSSPTAATRSSHRWRMPSDLLDTIADDASRTSWSSTSGCRRRTPTRAPGRHARSKPRIRTWACSSCRSTSRRPTRSSWWHSEASATCSRTGCSRSPSSSSAAQRVADGGSALDPQVVARLLSARTQDDPLDELTPREREVLELMAQGLTNVGIAKRLFLSERTVEAHVRHVLLKLGVPEGEDAHRRVLAVLAHVAARRV